MEEESGTSGEVPAATVTHLRPPSGEEGVRGVQGLDRRPQHLQRYSQFQVNLLD